MTELACRTLQDPLDTAESDAQLMDGVRRGDREAFEALVARYQQPLHNFVYRMVRDESDAEDVAQQTFVQVWKAAARYESKARVSTWIFTIARNLCLNEIRRRQRHPNESLDAGRDDGEGGELELQHADPSTRMASEEVCVQELHDKVSEALSVLPASQREALNLCREDFSYEEIAQILDTSVPSVKSLIFRAREALKSRIKPYLKHGGWNPGGGGNGS